MAFIARRNSDGKVVDVQMVSGCNNGDSIEGLSLPTLEDSDSDTDSTEGGFTFRTYGAPTVRRVYSDEVKTDVAADEATAMNNDMNDAVDIEEEYGEDTKYCEKSTVETYTAFGGYGKAALSKTTDVTVNAKVPEKLADELEMLGANISSLSFGDDNIDNFDLETYKPGDLTESETLLKCEDTLSISSYESGDMRTYNGSTGNLTSRTYDKGKATKEDMMHLDSAIGKSNSKKETGKERKKNQMKLYYGSSDSACSWTEMYADVLKPTDSCSNLVPTLSLGTTGSSSGSSTFYRNLDDEKTERDKEAAYKSWVERKKRQQQLKKQAEEKEKKRREEDIAVRQQMADERYAEWLRKKEMQNKKNTSTFTSKRSTPTLSAQASSIIKSRAKGPSEQAQKRLTDWQRAKEAKQQLERERQRKQKEAQEKLEESRKQMSETAWKNWMKTAAKRPKPVPLNQGLASLRGTVSDIYINPNEWDSSIDVNRST